MLMGYAAYNDHLAAIREGLVNWGGFENVRLIDAHSFCWMLIRVQMKLDEMERQGVRKPDDVNAALLKAAYRAYNTAAQSNGQSVERIVKNKEIFGFDSPEDFRMYLAGLWRAQGGQCKLTDLTMLFESPSDSDNELVLSVDRIDSSGHYEPGNLQLVCWFANRWKGVTDNTRFLELIELVREQNPHAQ